ncbi:TetR/AcrR family transcriptional regulator [Deinococcus aerophilus]|uniref:TetR family transcriptional regulator n=1 Tax=Deinococcus aerophilus TaxID=522488 RepID=A0ABQ2GKX4_9DEIO|nr:TetR/AcrR family transcriptional regulator [Deinococcus aerophilus]GGM01376.1 TetR family transcriptional regulator [Deinococcus aerophilus]
MISDCSRPIRARSATEKRQRRDDILRAAERLWAGTSYTDLSMNEVAREAGLAKGTLYLYFGTKEDLFLELLAGHLRDWTGRLEEALRREQPTTLTQLADVLVAVSADNGALRRLLVLYSTVLERQAHPDRLRDLQDDLHAPLVALTALMPCSSATAGRVLQHVYALSVGWQQLSGAPARFPFGPAGPSAAGTDPAGNVYGQEFELALRAVMARLEASHP